ncbi:twin transmembrane helix small protein [Roseateles sp.]|uniref:twin transmembrane helix small protein n=1 Tax=Roseateles sp. TaxID=1971397 RepID=UPI003264AF19
MKFVILIAFIGILGALAAAGFFMLRKGRGDRRSPNMARALAVRVGVSVALFLVILLSWWMGWIHPTGVPLSR